MVSDFAVGLLPDLYGCAEDMRRWRHVLDTVCAGLGVRSAAVQIFRKEGTGLRQCWCERDSYSAHHAEQHDAIINNDENPRTRHLPFGLPLEKVVRDDHYLPRREVEDIQRRLAMIGLRGGTSLLVEVAPTHFFSMILHRASDDGRGAERRDERLLTALAPHVRQASRLAVKAILEAQASASFATVADRLNLGWILCTREGELRWSNAAAETLIGRSTTLSLSGGRLRCDGAGALPQWRRLLATRIVEGETAALADPDGTIQVMAFPGQGLAGLRPEGAIGEDLVSLLLLDPAHMPLPNPEAVRDLFGLTRAEAGLAAGLCAGLSLNQYAEERGISTGTARIHLKRILAKTDSMRQADVVRKLCGSVIAQVRQTH